MTEHAYEYLPEDTPWDEYHQPAADAVAAMYQEPEIEAPRPGPDNAFGYITPQEIQAQYDAILQRSPDKDPMLMVMRMVRWVEAKYRVANSATLTALAAAEKKLQERTEWLQEAVEVVMKRQRIAELERQLTEVKRQSLQCEARYANLLSRSDEIIGRLRGQLAEAQGWIPVSERLPEASSPVLAYCTHEKFDEKWFEYHEPTIEQVVWIGRGWHNCGEWRRVSHWMPLPKRPLPAQGQESE